MEVNKSDWEVVQKAIGEWEANGDLSAEQATRLKSTLSVKRTELAQYFFLIALSCTLLAFGTIFIDDKLLEKIKAYFSLNNLIIALFTSLITVIWFVYVTRRKDRLSSWTFETYMVLGGLSALTSLIYICKEISAGGGYTLFLFIAAVLLFALSIGFRSAALWVGATLALMGWYGDFSYNHSTHDLFLGMNYPVRFTVFGLLLLGVALLQLKIKRLQYAQRITYTASLLIFFTGMWGVSIFGNFNSIEAWQQVRQVRVVVYAFVFAAASVAAFVLGIRYKDDMARDFGVLFLLVNLYTRYFEYFWDTMNKGIFFLILAITFGLLGRWLERKKRMAKHPKHNAVS